MHAFPPVKSSHSLKQWQLTGILKTAGQIKHTHYAQLCEHSLITQPADFC